MAVVGVVAVLVFVVFSGDDSPSDEVSGHRGRDPGAEGSRPEKAAELAKCTYEPKLANEGSRSRGEGLQGLGLPAEPADLRQPLPAVVRGRHLRAGDTPELGKLVHTLEHGRIDIQYKPGTPATTVAQLETLYNEMDGGHHLLLFENGTGMKSAVAATAWDASLNCATMNPQVFDAIRAFRTEHIDKGPEIVP